MYLFLALFKTLQPNRKKKRNQDERPITPVHVNILTAKTSLFLCGSTPDSA